MKRRWYAALGVLELAVGTGIALFADVGPVAGAIRYPQSALWLLAGACSVAAGLRRSIRGVEWFRLVGASNVLVGTSFVLQLAGTVTGDPTAEMLIVDAVMVLGGLSLAALGVTWLRGAEGFDLSRYEHGTADEG